eukprot:6152941-Pleurochrysis_carterae.AAC.1
MFSTAFGQKPFRQHPFCLVRCRVALTLVINVALSHARVITRNTEHTYEVIMREASTNGLCHEFARVSAIGTFGQYSPRNGCLRFPEAYILVRGAFIFITFTSVETTLIEKLTTVCCQTNVPLVLGIL